MAWITDRKPARSELSLLSFHGITYLGGHFLTWDGEAVEIDYFEAPDLPDGEGTAKGCWHRPGVLAWQPLPEPPLTNPIRINHHQQGA